MTGHCKRRLVAAMTLTEWSEAVRVAAATPPNRVSTSATVTSGYAQVMQWMGEREKWDGGVRS